MTWSPETTVLNQVNENKNVNHTITYSETAAGIGGAPGVTTTYTVTLKAIDTNATINVNNNNISGYYTDAFVNNIQYRTPGDDFVNTQHWKDINRANESEMIYYKADPSTDRTYRYLATASNGATKTYEIVVVNDWTSGRDSLLKEVHYSLTVTKPNTGYTPNADAADGSTAQGFYPGKFTAIKVTWVNNKNQTTVWKNSGDTNYDWVNFV
jgi:hypothetical protein